MPVAAIALLTQLLTTNPENEEALTLRAVTLVQMGQTKEALTDVDTLITLQHCSWVLVLPHISASAFRGQVLVILFPCLGNKITRVGNKITRVGNNIGSNLLITLRKFFARPPITGEMKGGELLYCGGGLLKFLGLL